MVLPDVGGVLCRKASGRRTKKASPRVMGHWQASTGDCRQELVFIGQNIDFAQMRAELDACLLTDEEMALGVDALALAGRSFWPLV